jgi:hypothetical protein
MRITTWQGAGAALLALATLTLGGCTAGEVVDANYRAYPVSANSRLMFLAVDGNNQLTGKSYEYPFDGTSSYVSFDPYAADGRDAASGITNVKKTIPSGRYYVSFVSDTTPSPAVSPIFDHSYPDTCNDYFTGASGEPCVKYYFRVQLASCSSNPFVGSPCCTGVTGCAVPSLETHGGASVIPLYAPLD